MKFSSLKVYIKHPVKLLTRIGKNSFLKGMSDEKYLKMIFKDNMGYPLDLENPKTFNEKLQWLKLYDRKPIYTTMVDKYEAKKYVADVIGEEYIIPTLGVWDSFDDIDFDKLPEQFVLKCTHDSGGLVICRDKSKLDMEHARKKIERCLKRSYYWPGREWPYKNVTPRIIAEAYMENEKIGELRDYKLFSFNGEVKVFKIDYDRFKNHRANYYTPDGELLRFGEIVCPPDFDRNIKLPRMKDKMIALAKELSVGHPFMRVDFYEIGDKIYFGELTLYPASGLGPFEPKEWDLKLGEWIKLPNKGLGGANEI